MKIFDGPGRGRKQCGKCGIYVGVRTTDCQCGYVFDSSTKSEKVEKKVDTKLKQPKKEKNRTKTFVQSKLGPKVFESPGKGRKYCEGCGKFVGLRCKECPNCQHKFTFKEEKAKPTIPKEFKEPTPDEIEAQNFLSALGGDRRLRSNVILTPSEKCPVTLRGTTEDDVWEFCEFLLAEGKVAGRLYAPSAIRQFVRETYNVNSKEYQKVSNQIDRWIRSKGVKND